MKLVCPGCGCTASAEAWSNDTACRDLLAAVVQYSSPLPPVVLDYLSLFRPQNRALSWKKALRLAKELAKLTGPGHVQIQGRVARPCPPHIWAQAMENMIDRRGRFDGPLKNHNYLRQVAYGLADAADAQVEKKKHEDLQNPYCRTPSSDAADEWWLELSDEEFNRLPVHIKKKYEGERLKADR